MPSTAFIAALSRSLADTSWDQRTRAAGSYIQAEPDHLREPMQKVIDRFKELIGLPGLEGDNVEKLRPGA